MYTYMYIYIRICTYICMNIFVYMYIYIYIHTRNLGPINGQVSFTKQPDLCIALF